MTNAGELANRISAALALLPPDPQPDFDEVGQFWGFGKATGHTSYGPDRAHSTAAGWCFLDRPCPACLPDPLVVALRAALTGEPEHVEPKPDGALRLARALIEREDGQ